jgi:hypothetical protein
MGRSVLDLTKGIVNYMMCIQFIEIFPSAIQIGLMKMVHARK